MNLTEDQQYFLSILRETGFIRLDQVLPLLRINEPQKEIIHAGALLRRLRYMGLLARSGDGCICLPDLLRDRPDSEILLSLDVLLALRPERLLQVSARQPYKLCLRCQNMERLEQSFLDPFWNPIAVHIGRKALGIKPAV